MPSAHRSTLDLAARLGVHADRCRVVATRELSPSLREIVLHGDPRLVGEPGRDVMVRVSDAERSTRRRYSVRWADASTHRFGLWVSVAVALLVLLALAVFILQNGDHVKVSYLGAHGSLPLGVALLLAAVFGGLVVVLAGTVRILELRRRARGTGRARHHGRARSSAP